MRVCSILRGPNSPLDARTLGAANCEANPIYKFSLVQTSRCLIEQFSKLIGSMRENDLLARVYRQSQYFEKFRLWMASRNRYLSHLLRKCSDAMVTVQMLRVGWPKINNCCLDYSVVVQANFGGYRWLNPPI